MSVVEPEACQIGGAGIARIVTDFLVRSTAITAASEIGPDTELLQDGVLDSLGIMQLVMFIGDELGVEVEDEDFVPENFDTLGMLVAFISRKRSAMM